MSAINVVPTRSAPSEETIDDLDAYLATLSDEERRRIALAGVAFDLVALLEHSHADGAASEAVAAEIAALRRAVVGYFQDAGVAGQIGTLQRYLNELGYSLVLDLVKIETDESVGQLRLPTEVAD